MELKRTWEGERDGGLGEEEGEVMQHGGSLDRGRNAREETGTVSLVAGPEGVRQRTGTDHDCDRDGKIAVKGQAVGEGW